MLVEDIISQKTNLGGEYQFLPDSLENRANEIGVHGVFTKVDRPSGSEIISVEKTNGTLTTLRAYEEAQDLLKRLGGERFNLGDQFIQASALYSRYSDERQRSEDILVMDFGAEEMYASSPMRAYKSEALARLLNFNDSAEIERTRKSDQLIESLGVDSNTFRCMMAYSRSRCWREFGIIPIMDLLNSSTANSANCSFIEEENRLKFVARRKIFAGEELTWQYNAADAIWTWFGYGYVDSERPVAANCEVHLEETEEREYDAFLMKHFDVDTAHINSRTSINNQILEFSLPYPGNPRSKISLKNDVAVSLHSFRTMRGWLRALALSQSNHRIDSVTIDQLGDDGDLFGKELEKGVLQRIRTSIDKGAKEEDERIHAFSQTDVGKPIDMSPLKDMRESARESWKNSLDVILEILSANDESSLLGVIWRRFKVKHPMTKRHTFPTNYRKNLSR
ncbi:MAG: SET domain-containing protein-lysine N-methyltransferase [Cyanobacteria bacterium J06649_11]